ncbi:hypothetical protein J41TS12_10380 [Paenibacillus antibioticophila]|uniref:Uncharacterized protein n=1 Tax=Paenibacillus antibioticophila TaxID=1274374 RepID=A0A920CGY1_9BACL|nr:hypothetical protein J41TS12_10380 [Paenibacillus antibioticophila]
MEQPQDRGTAEATARARSYDAAGVKQEWNVTLRRAADGMQEWKAARRRAEREMQALLNHKLVI